jgi:hypothetical protein
MRILILMLTILLSGCVLWPDDTWSDAPHAPKPGDLVRVETRDRVKHVFRVYKTEEHAFYGVARDGLKYKIPYGALKSLEVRDTELTWVTVPFAGNAVSTAIMGPILLGN